MMMEGEGVLRSAEGGSPSTGLLGALSAWEFQWSPQGASEQWAHVTGLVRWRGFDIGFAADGLLGVDGRLAAPSVATMPPHLQQLVLQHFADDCLSQLKGSPLGDMTLESLQWHEDPLPMEGEFEFTLKRAELPRVTRGRLTVFDKAGRLQLINALATLQWPLPPGLSTLGGHLEIGSTRLSAEECAGLEEGDLVWLDDAEVAPMGLRARFIPSDESEAACSVWIKRSSLRWQSWAQENEAEHTSPTHDASVRLNACSPEMSVPRAWHQGAVREQSMAKTALALPWLLSDHEKARFEAQLLVVGRRLGLRVTHVF